MKNILLLGDSIRMGYDSIVREILQDEAQVTWHTENARYAPYTMRALTGWKNEDIRPETIDLIHWNNGLWDILHHGFDEETQTSPEEYRRDLKGIIRRLRRFFPNAKICFANTTFVIEESYGKEFYRRNSDIEHFNRIAAEVMEVEGIPIDDLYSVSRDMPREYHTPDGTHFTPEGYRVLAEAVCAFLRGQKTEN